MGHIPPDPLPKRGIRYLVDKINEVLDYVVKTHPIPTRGHSETEWGTMPPPQQAVAPTNAMAATGLFCSEDLEAIFEQSVASGYTAHAAVALNHADQLEIFSTLRGTEPRWFITDSSGVIWYISDSADIYGSYTRQGTPTPSQGSAPASITVNNFPAVLTYDNGTTYTVYYQQGGFSGDAIFQDTSATVTLGWNTSSSKWMSDGTGGTDEVSSTFCDPTGGPSSGGVTVSYLGF